ncbi:MAG: hypothetical protein WBV92_01885 [Nitrosotalea sp.]
MESHFLSYVLIISGLVSDFTGVIILTVLTDSALDSLIDKMNRFVDDSWEDNVKKWKSKKKQFTIFGIGFLIFGLALGLYGNWITL